MAKGQCNCDGKRVRHGQWQSGGTFANGNVIAYQRDEHNCKYTVESDGLGSQNPSWENRSQAREVLVHGVGNWECHGNGKIIFRMGVTNVKRQMRGGTGRHEGRG